tara:strand:- start:673 stop:1056 length:384 start_codon:yes stop_codon:yes gene_type:complete
MKKRSLDVDGMIDRSNCDIAATITERDVVEDSSESKERKEKEKEQEQEKEVAIEGLKKAGEAVTDMDGHAQKDSKLTMSDKSPSVVGKIVAGGLNWMVMLSKDGYMQSVVLHPQGGVTCARLWFSTR